MSIFAFAIGVIMLQRLPALPAAAQLAGATMMVLLGIAISAAVPMVGAWRQRLAAWPCRVIVVALAFACGFVWAAWRAEWRLADELPMAWESRDVEVVGVVTGLPQVLDRSVRFVLTVESSAAPLPRYIQLSWYPPRTGSAAVPDLRPGERWQLTVRLKRPHGFVNPHGFDYEAWLLERNIRATGYVRTATANENQNTNFRLAASVPGAMNFVHRARDAVRVRFAAALPEAAYGGVLIALAVGDQRAIPNEQWEVFRRTAVAHLVSISGLHVSLVALIGAALAGWGWRRSAWLVLRVPARKVAAMAGLLSAAAYAVMAGLGLPTQRALIMLAVAAVALALGREPRASRVMAVALWCVLVVDPWAVLAAGFWLSFGAVGVIVYVLGGRLGSNAGWRSAVKIQLAITLATTPLLLVLFNAFSLVAPIANAVAIPLVSFIIAPLSLLAIMVPWPALLQLAHWATGLMMVWLQWLAELPFAMWQQASSPALLTGAALIGVAWLLLPRGAPGRHAALLALLPMLWWVPSRPVEGEFRVTVLDVGQGMAVHVQTASRDLLYDTGPPYGPTADAGSRVLLPYFAASGVTALDRMVISHGDSDHVGGAGSLIAGMPVRELISSLPEDHVLRASQQFVSRACAAGEVWDWDGVAFELLHPAAHEPVFLKDNDNSCVLRVSARSGAVLLAGDIEALAEASLLSRAGASLSSEVVLVPHHGSRTSSTPEFVAAVAATHAIHAVGNLNPFRHPHPAVWARWSAAGTRNWRTDAQGAILVTVGDDGVKVESQRSSAPRYWHGR